jgi:hypothetical protein
MATKYFGSVVIANVRYGWNIKRTAHVEAGGLTGHSVYVFVHDGSGRDLILDFPYGELGALGRTEGQAATIAALRECLPLALGAGWDPAKRGKPLRLDVRTLRESGRARPKP